VVTLKMPLTKAVTDLESLKEHPAVARLLAWKPTSILGIKFDRTFGRFARFYATTRHAPSTISPTSRASTGILPSRVLKWFITSSQFQGKIAYG